MEDYCKILIIDDEYIMRQGLKHMIDWEAEGFTVVGDASNGQEGIAMVEQYHPHIILCDMVMPIMDGIEFTSIMSQKYPETQIIILSGYDKFEYVRNTMKNGAVDYILKPTINPVELTNTLNKVAKNIPGLKMNKNKGFQYDRYMERYLLGYDENLDRKEFQKYFTQSNYIMVLVHIKKFNEKGKDMMSMLYSKLEDYVESFSYGKALLMLLEEKNACIVLNTDSFGVKETIAGIDKLSEQMSHLCDRLLFVRTKPVNDIRDLKDLYSNQMVVGVNRKFYHKDEYIIECGQDKWDAKIEKFDYSKYSQFLDKKRYKDGLDMLYDYANKAIDGRIDEFKLKNQIQNMLYNLIFTFDAKEVDIEELRQKLFARIDATSYAEDFKELLDGIRDDINLFVKDKQENDNEIISKILNYIHDHYNEELDLAEVAKVFNFNYSYLSYYFNYHVKEGFSEYLNGIRVNEACNLLKDSDRTIVEISEIVGYSDQSYFSRVFKKITGMSPMMWRKQNTNNNA